MNTLFNADPGKLDPKDRRFILKSPDSDFSPERNKQIVEQSIKDYEVMRAKKTAEHDDSYAERSDAVVSYLRHLDRGATTPMEKYFGKKMLAYLRGQQIRERLMAGMTLQNKKGEIIKI